MSTQGPVAVPRVFYSAAWISARRQRSIPCSFLPACGLGRPWGWAQSVTCASTPFPLLLLETLGRAGWGGVQGVGSEPLADGCPTIRVPWFSKFPPHWFFPMRPPELGSGPQLTCYGLSAAGPLQMGFVLPWPPYPLRPLSWLGPFQMPSAGCLPQLSRAPRTACAPLPCQTTYMQTVLRLSLILSLSLLFSQSLLALPAQAALASLPSRPDLPAPASSWAFQPWTHALGPPESSFSLGFTGEAGATSCLVLHPESQPAVPLGPFSLGWKRGGSSTPLGSPFSCAALGWVMEGESKCPSENLLEAWTG